MFILLAGRGLEHKYRPHRSVWTPQVGCRSRFPQARFMQPVIRTEQSDRTGSHGGAHHASRRPAVLPEGHPRRRRGRDRGRGRDQQTVPVRHLPVQGCPGRRLSAPAHPARPAIRTSRPPTRSWRCSTSFMPASPRAISAAARSSMPSPSWPRTAKPPAPLPPASRKNAASTSRPCLRQAGAPDPDRLASQIALLIEGAIAVHAGAAGPRALRCRRKRGRRGADWRRRRRLHAHEPHSKSSFMAVSEILTGLAPTIRLPCQGTGPARVHLFLPEHPVVGHPLFCATRGRRSAAPSGWIFCVRSLS